MKVEDKVNSIMPTDILVPDDRQRQDLGDLSELKDSIDEVGQIQPIVVEIASSDEGTSHYRLVAGHRRLEACRELEIFVDAIFWHDLTEFERARIELDENIRRKQLSWHERDAAEKRIVLIAADQGMSLRSVAASMESSAGGLSDRVAMADAVEVFPQLKECKSRHEAAKTLKNLMHQELIDEQMRREKEKADGEIKKPDELDLSVFDGKMLSGTFGVDSKSYAEGSADIVVFDPPFGIELQDVKQKDYSAEASQQTEGIYKDSREAFVELFPTWLTEIYRLMATNSHLWVFFGIEWYPFVAQTLHTLNFKYDKIPYIWHKQGSSGQTNNPNYYAGRVYETFMFAWKGEQTLARRGLPNVIEAPVIPSSEKIHETEKPLLLLDNILRRSYWPGACVLDPMFGSGSTFRALMGLGTTKFFGWELSKEKRDRSLLKALAHARNLVTTPGFSLTHYDEVARVSDSAYNVGDRIKWLSATDEEKSGTIVEINMQYNQLMVDPDDKNFGWSKKMNPDGRPPNFNYPVKPEKVTQVLS
jgi:ParB/RepB/Spo0J family partition protein